MNASRKRSWLPWLAAVSAVALFSGLGLWQLERAADKRAIIAALERESRTPVEALPGDTAGLRALAFREVSVRGRFLDKQFLLDNRLFEGRPGFDVLTPLSLADGRVILVDRGWVPAGPRRQPQATLTPPAGQPVGVRGRRWLPQTGIGLGPARAPVNSGGGDPAWPRMATRVEFDALEAALGQELIPAVIRADGDARWLYRPRPLRPAFGPMRHYGYAFQWFALALTVVVVSGVLLRQRRRKGIR